MDAQEDSPSISEKQKKNKENKKQNRNIAIINETKHHYTHLLDGDEEGKRKGVRRGSDRGAAEERNMSGR